MKIIRMEIESIIRGRHFYHFDLQQFGFNPHHPYAGSHFTFSSHLAHTLSQKIKLSAIQAKCFSVFMLVIDIQCIGRCMYKMHKSILAFGLFHVPTSIWLQAKWVRRFVVTLEGMTTTKVRLSLIPPHDQSVINTDGRFSILSELNTTKIKIKIDMCKDFSSSSNRELQFSLVFLSQK